MTGERGAHLAEDITVRIWRARDVSHYTLREWLAWRWRVATHNYRHS
jgi:hypothetical protein